MRRVLAVTVLAVVAPLLSGGSAGAAYEVGDRCRGDERGADTTAIVLDNGLSTLELSPIVLAESGGVVTHWRAEVEPALAGTRQQLLVLQQVDEQTDRLVGESAVETLAAGVNEFAAHVPAPEYAHVGLRGPEETVFCDKPDGHLAGFVDGAFALGESRDFSIAMNTGVPVIATVEPDADGDGYGDESQDGCPSSPLYVGACPLPVTLAVKRRVRKRSILLKVRPSGPASVDVYGQVGWNFKPKRKRRSARRHRRGAGASKRGRKRLIVGLNGGKKNVAPGAVTRFTIRLPKPVLLRLSRLNRKESVRAKLTLRATNPAGVSKNTRLRVKLRGWRPVR